MLLQVLMSDGTVEQKPLDDYLAGVILAEMPASFGEEALKAQAVVSRTYTLRQTARKTNMTARTSVRTPAAARDGFPMRITAPRPEGGTGRSPGGGPGGEGHGWAGSGL